MRKLLIALGVLIVLFIAVDRIALVIAEDEVASQIATAYSMPVDPGVSITGFPFLTQVVSGDYQQIGVTADQIQADGVTLHDLNVHLTGVHATISQLLGGGASTITADRATGTALVDFATVEQRLPHGVRLAPDGKSLKVSGTVSYNGITVPVSAAAALAVTPSGISVRPEDVTVAGGISLPSSYTSRLHFTVPLGNLPLHLHVTSVQVTPGGLRVGAAARNVQFART
jgi:LmeA-like phospholipid-binding